MTLTGANYQNQSEPLDVNDDGLIEALDSLLIANALTGNGDASFPASDLDGITPVLYLDVDGDDTVSSLDFDAVVAYLNQNGATGATGPAGSTGPNQPPVPDAAGPYSIQAGETLYLDGYMSYDPDGGPNSLTYEWDLDGDGSADATGSYVYFDWSDFESSYGFTIDSTQSVTLTVNDGDDSDTDVFNVMVAANQPPVADAAGPYSMQAGDTLYLDGYMSYDPDGAPSSLTYAWDLDRDGIAEATGAYVDFDWSDLESSYGVAMDSTQSVTLTVNDGANVGTDVFDVVIAANQPPVADAGGDH